MRTLLVSVAFVREVVLCYTFRTLADRVVPSAFVLARLPHGGACRTVRIPATQ